MRTNPDSRRRPWTAAARMPPPRTRRGQRSIALACAVVTAAVLSLPAAHGADTGPALYAKLTRDAVPAKLQGEAKVQVLDLPAEERSAGLVGSILVSLPKKSHLRYFVFDTRENAARGYARYVKAPWGPPMKRIIQDELKPEKNLAPGVLTCELQRNESTRLFVSACLHRHATLPVLTRSTQPVTVNDGLKFADAEVERMRSMLAAADALGLLTEGTKHVEKVAGR